MKYQPKPVSNTDQLVNALRTHGGALRTSDLADRTGLHPSTIPALLDTPVKHGLVVMCKIEQPGNRKPTNEYRIGSGIVPLTERPEMKPPKPTIVPVREALGRPVKPKRGKTPQPIFPPPVGLAENSQPAVEQNTGSDGQGATPSTPADVAVAAMATPAPEAKPGLGQAQRKAPAGDDLVITIDQDGAVTIVYDDEFIVDLSPAQTLALGDFMHLSEGLWRR